MIKNYRIKMALLVLSIVFSSSFLMAQSTNFWTNVTESNIQTSGNRLINPDRYLTLNLDINGLKTKLATAQLKGNTSSPVVIILPHPDGKNYEYQVFLNTTMSPGLAAQFPEIRSYDALAMDQSGRTVKLDITPQGFHAMILSPTASTIYIDPYSFGGTDIENYQVYYRKDFKSNKVFSCDVETITSLDFGHDEITPKAFGTCELRTYRVAISATGEYTIFHGGTVAQAQAAQVTTMNRVNGIYERDIAITMEIIPNNNLLIYTSTTSDPFTNGNPNSMITQNQNTINNVIGSANYDIGHVFGTNSGGLAGLGVVCNSTQKARGVTGSGAPVGDPFDIDYVAHEMGHQFRGNHTFNNSCNGNRNAGTAVEPGSGTTIMAYAGICVPNVANNSDDHFHGRTLQEIGSFITGPSHTCPVKTPLTNTAPIIASTAGNTTIPANTPFSLTAIASDADGDPLTYCWEQMDVEISTQSPVPTATSGPSFRSLTPNASPTRYFPNIPSLLSNGPFTWEVLPSTSRTMKFRVTVRDNAVGGGCNDHRDLTITTTSSAGPFVVVYPSFAGIIWQIGTNKTVLWDVANTDASPVSCANVSILLSIDGGQTFTTLIASTPNDGSQSVLVPNTATTQAIIMVRSSNGTFFDISDNVFTISTEAGCDLADIPTIAGDLSICAGGTTTLSIASGNLYDATQWVWYANSCGGTNIGTGTSVTISAPGFYYVRGEGGCAVNGLCKSFYVQTTNVITTVTQTGLSLKANQASATYQWLKCPEMTPIAGQTGQVFTATVNGSYAVQVNKSGCLDTSDCILINTVGIENINHLNIQIFPNPISDILTVDFGKEVQLDNVFITDAWGRIIYDDVSLNTQTLKIDLSKESTGIYFLNIQANQEARVLKIIKQ
jgi:hypothetical protein